jgi:hypothetical protein
VVIVLFSLESSVMAVFSLALLAQALGLLVAQFLAILTAPTILEVVLELLRAGVVMMS